IPPPTATTYTLSLHDALPIFLTDVYHLAATSLKMHVPAIGIGRAGVLQSSTLSDLKKKALFASLHGDDYYLETEESAVTPAFLRSEEHTSELQSRFDLVCRLL